MVCLAESRHFCTPSWDPGIDARSWGVDLRRKEPKRSILKLWYPMPSQLDISLRQTQGRLTNLVIAPIFVSSSIADPWLCSKKVNRQIALLDVSPRGAFQSTARDCSQFGTPNELSSELSHLRGKCFGRYLSWFSRNLPCILWSNKRDVLASRKCHCYRRPLCCLLLGIAGYDTYPPQGCLVYPWRRIFHCRSELKK